MTTKQLLLSLCLFWMISGCNSSSTETREMLPEPDKDLREKYEKRQDSISNQQVQKIPMH